MTARIDARRLRGEAGMVGGAEALPFGVLIFVVGTLMVTNAWAVIDAHLAVASAAREATRTYVEAADRASGLAAAQAAAGGVLAGYGRDPAKLMLAQVAGDDDALVRCDRVTFSASYEVPALSLPFVGGMGPSAFRATATHSELVDPYRSGSLEAGTCA